MRPLVQQLERALTPLVDLPFALFGHSLGAYVAFEVARRLQARCRPPQAIFLSGAPAPQLPQRRQPLWRLPDAAFLEAVHGYGGIPSEIWDQPELLALFLPSLRADFELFGTYVVREGEALTCPVFLMAGANDPHASPQAVHAWRQLLPEARAPEVFEGGHFYVAEQRDPVIRFLIRSLDGLR